MMFGKIVNLDEITDEYVEVWMMYFEAFWLFNVVGEAIPQFIIRLIFPFHKILLQSNLAIRNVLIGNKLALRNFLWITNPFIS